MKNLTYLAVLFVTAAAGSMTCPAIAQAVDVEARVNGGGRADFAATPNSVNTTGFTNFSVGVAVYDDGTAHGHFVCQIPGVVIISGDVIGGWVNPDGSVTIVGIAHGVDHFFGEGFSDLPFTATLRAGGPGVGGFDYRDESGFFGLGQFDTEVIRRGMIRIAD